MFYKLSDHNYIWRNILACEFTDWAGVYFTKKCNKNNERFEIEWLFDTLGIYSVSPVYVELRGLAAQQLSLFLKFCKTANSLLHVQHIWSIRFTDWVVQKSPYYVAIKFENTLARSVKLSKNTKHNIKAIYGCLLNLEPYNEWVSKRHTANHIHGVNLFWHVLYFIFFLRLFTAK